MNEIIIKMHGMLVDVEFYRKVSGTMHNVIGITHQNKPSLAHNKMDIYSQFEMDNEAK